MDWDHWQRLFRRNLEPHWDTLVKWANERGLHPEALNLLGVGYDPDKKAFTFPERDSDDNIVGIECRHVEKGQKWMIQGSKRGLIYAPDPDWGGLGKAPDPIIIPEGTTDTAAAMSLDDGSGVGFFAIGRPSATGSAESNAWLQQLVKGHQVIVMGENDGGAGMHGANKLAHRLKEHAYVWLKFPPEQIKDFNEWIQNEPKDTIYMELDAWIKRKPSMDQDIEQPIAGDVLESTQFRRIAKTFLNEKCRYKGISRLRKWIGRWWWWTHGRYGKVEHLKIEQMLRSWLENKHVLVQKDKSWVEVEYEVNTYKVNNILSELQTLEEVYVGEGAEMPCWLDGRWGPDPRRIVSLRDCLYDIDHYVKTGQHKVYENTPAFFSAWTLPYDFDPDAEAPYSKGAIADILRDDPDAQTCVWQYFGLMMTPDNSWEKFMMFVGRPNAGKGTVQEIMYSLLGKHNIAASGLSELGGEFALQPLVGKLACSMGDVHVPSNQTGTTALERLKNITGNDAVSVNQKNIAPVDVRLICRFLLSVNELPNLPDRTGSLRRRALVVFFNRSFEKKQDPTLKRRIASEGPGQFLEALKYYRQLRTQGGWSRPKLGDQVAQVWFSMMAPVLDFANHYLVSGDSDKDWVAKKELYQAYKDHCDEHGIKPVAQNRFGQQLLSVMPWVRSGKSPRDAAGVQTNAYLGLRWREDDESQGGDDDDDDMDRD